MKQPESLNQTSADERRTEMTSADVVDFYTKLDSLGVTIWIDGGWGVDALLESRHVLTRIWISLFRIRMCLNFVNCLRLKGTSK
jgi:aminoglycoside-2''-adenylyltransferase